MSLLGAILGKKVDQAKAAASNAAAELTLAAVVLDGNKMVNELIDCVNSVDSPKAGDLIADVAFAMRALYENFERDPRDIETARNFIRYQAPRSVELVKGYVAALSSGTCSGDDQREVEETLRKVIESFNDFLAKCRENDTTGLEFQSKSLDRLLHLQTVAPSQS